MSKTAILIGPVGLCDDRQRQEIQELFGCTKIIDHWDGKSTPPPGALIFTDKRPPFEQLDGYLSNSIEVRIYSSAKSLQQTIVDLRHSLRLQELTECRA